MTEELVPYGTSEDEIETVPMDQLSTNFESLYLKAAGDNLRLTQGIRKTILLLQGRGPDEDALVEELQKLVDNA